MDLYYKSVGTYLGALPEELTREIFSYLTTKTEIANISSINNLLFNLVRHSIVDLNDFQQASLDHFFIGVLEKRYPQLQRISGEITVSSRIELRLLFSLNLSKFMARVRSESDYGYLIMISGLLSSITVIEHIAILFNAGRYIKIDRGVLDVNVFSDIQFFNNNKFNRFTGLVIHSGLPPFNSSMIESLPINRIIYNHVPSTLQTEIFSTGKIKVIECSVDTWNKLKPIMSFMGNQYSCIPSVIDFQFAVNLDDVPELIRVFPSLRRCYIAIRYSEAYKQKKEHYILLNSQYDNYLRSSPRRRAEMRKTPEMLTKKIISAINDIGDNMEKENMDNIKLKTLKDIYPNHEFIVC